MIKSYKVAGLLFQVQMADDHPLWNHMGQYEPFLTQDEDEPIFRLDVVESIGDPLIRPVYVTPVEPGEPVVNLYSTPEGEWYYEMAPLDTAPVCAVMISSSDFKSGKVVLEKGRNSMFGLNNSLMLLFAFRTAGMGVLEMHASVIKYKDRGYLFLAKSGTGKSTQSQQWLKAIPGASLLNDDNPIVRLLPDGTTMVYGSPWSGKTPCYKNDQCPVGAFVRIRRCQENRITPTDIFESYANLYSSSSGFKADRDMADGLHKTLEGIVTSVPCYVLDCLPDEDAARVCAKGVVKNG